MFNFLWIFMMSIRWVASRLPMIWQRCRFGPGAQGLGQTIGPFAASVMLDIGWGFDGVFILCALASATALLIYLAIYLKYRHAGH